MKRILLCVFLWAPSIAAAHVAQGDAVADSASMQHMHEHGAHRMSGMTPMTRAGHENAEHEGMTMPGSGMLGGYSMSRDGSGTSWVPESALMHGLHVMRGPWMIMTHGTANVLYDHQGGPRGDDMVFSTSMLMVMASRPLGSGRLGLHSMVSLDPAMGARGYPLLLQTGETADGVTPLVDRQHPHDLFMELAASYSVPIGGKNSVFVYAGYPGEPALGPCAFMHRASGSDNPEAPLGHHWLDSSHIAFGVATLGLAGSMWKVEGSAFRGREPDQHRWGFDPLTLDSYSARVTLNPSADWSLQASHGRLEGPEQLEPDVDVHRTTASATYNRAWFDGNWQTTAAWGLNANSPGHTTSAFLLESALRLHEAHTVFARAEYVGKDELFEPPDPLAGEVLHVGTLTAGYAYDRGVTEHIALGMGALGSLYALPERTHLAYDSQPASAMVFLRATVR